MGFPVLELRIRIAELQTKLKARDREIAQLRAEIRAWREQAPRVRENAGELDPDDPCPPRVPS
jgi:predicted  nucleic acid-binding Zn-ribbon protein